MINATVIGRIGKDAETRKVGDTTVTSFSVASNSRDKGKDTTLWVDANIWGNRGEKLKQYLTKGSNVTVIGELTSREHQGKTYLTLRVDHIELQGGKSGGGTGNAPAPSKSTDLPVDNDGSDDIPF